MDPPRNCCCSGGKSSGCTCDMYNGLVTVMEDHVYLGGCQELITIKDSQQGIVDCEVLILQNNPFSSKRAAAEKVFGKAKKLRSESNDLIGFKSGNPNLYTGFTQVNDVLEGQ